VQLGREKQDSEPTLKYDLLIEYEHDGCKDSLILSSWGSWLSICNYSSSAIT